MKPRLSPANRQTMRLVALILPTVTFDFKRFYATTVEDRVTLEKVLNTLDHYEAEIRHLKLECECRLHGLSTEMCEWVIERIFGEQ